MIYNTQRRMCARGGGGGGELTIGIANAAKSVILQPRHAKFTHNYHFM